MDKKLQKELAWLEKEMKKDLKEVTNHKKMMIEEIKSLDKNKIFVEKPKKKISIWDKILIIFGHGKKG
jgi:hypothetical protein